MANNTGLIAGTAYLTADGVNYQLEGELKYDAGSVTRESKSGQDTVHGFSEMPKSPYISASIRDSGGLSLAGFNAMRSVTLVLELANGKTVIGRNMWTVEAQEVDTTEAKFTCRWEGLQGAVTEQ
ncbi:phage tail protein [Burkholderia pseudomallei]|uniref:phage tail tube protein n=1 Tax=Burkholderia pseudomallei TaxID=28450 RepID=UPI000A1A1617|nr:phage tail tube protein [Burkholderia pseudomallei]ARK81025.1 phage tail protein [Burkholderia pseudomallei]ARL45394.1 phage tail protein [Burkholderia pseudomallei]